MVIMINLKDCYSSIEAIGIIMQDYNFDVVNNNVMSITLIGIIIVRTTPFLPLH